MTRANRRWSASDLASVQRERLSGVRVHRLAAEVAGNHRVSPTIPTLRQMAALLVPAERNDKYRFVPLCISNGLPAPEPEHRFHSERRWVFDYAWPDHWIAVEVEGGIWRKGGGAHSRPSNIERDIQKYNAATMAGWRVLRYAPEDLSTAIADVRSLIDDQPQREL